MKSKRTLLAMAIPSTQAISLNLISYIIDIFQLDSLDLPEMD